MPLRHCGPHATTGPITCNAANPTHTGCAGRDRAPHLAAAAGFGFARPRCTLYTAAGYQSNASITLILER